MAMFDDLFPKRTGTSSSWGANPVPPAPPALPAPPAPAESFGAMAARRLRAGMTNVIGGVARTVSPVTSTLSDFAQEYWGAMGTPGTKPASAPVAPAPDMAFAPGAPRGMYEGTVGAPAVVAAPAGPNIVTGGLDPATSRLLSAARQNYANAPDNQMFAKNWGPLQDQYQAGGGTWLGRTAADDANIARQAKIEAAYAKIGTAKTVPGQKAAVDAFNILQGAENTRLTSEATTSAATAGHQLTAQTAQNKLMVDLLGPAAQEHLAKGNIDILHAELARKILDPNTTPADREKAQAASAALKGRFGAVDKFSESITSMPDPKTGAITLINRGQGAAQRVIPTPPVQPITMREAVASAKKNKTYQSEDQVRRDIAKIPGYKLID